MAESGRTDDQVASTRTLQGEDADARAEDLAVSSRRPSSLALLADLERRVRRLEARVDALEGPGSPSRRLVKTSDVVRWGLWLVVIAFLAYFWLGMGAPR
ncbi:MAG: hypothetical protein JW940_38880 [Polyangiaceae bacterium]|nr:hypothetical protein [Polyangiaceae bacterium]